MAVIEIFEDHGPALSVNLAKPIGGRVVLLGFSARETAGAVAQVLMINGSDASGLENIGVNLSATGSTRDWFGPEGVLFDNGYFPVITGAVSGTVWVRYNRGARR